jgi:hypothetical protein
LATLLILLVALGTSGHSQADNECARIAHLPIYSVTSTSKETGDLDGYELAIEQHDDSTVDAWLYVYEGAPNKEGIHISGTIAGQILKLKGTWDEHMIDYPSKKEIVQTHLVEMQGTLDPTWFRGTLKIEGLFTPDNVKLKRTQHIWLCKR